MKSTWTVRITSFAEIKHAARRARRVISCPDLTAAKVFAEQNSGPNRTRQPQGGSACQQWDKVTEMASGGFKTAHSEMQMCLGSIIKLIITICVSDVVLFWWEGGQEEGRRKDTIQCVPGGLSKAIPELLALVTWDLQSSGYPSVFSLQTLDSFYSKQQACMTPAARS